MVLIGLLLAAGCGLAGFSRPAEPAARDRFSSFAAERSEPPGSAAMERIAAGDVLRIDAGAVAEVTGEHRVSPSGRLELDLAGSVEADGLRPEDLEAELLRRLERYVVGPEVSVTIVSSERRSVVVRGAVVAPGRVSLAKGGTTLLEAVTAAGGPTQDASGVVRVTPARLPPVPGLLAEPLGPEDRNDVVEMPLEDLLLTGRGAAAPVYLHPGDVVEVPPVDPSAASEDLPVVAAENQREEIADGGRRQERRQRPIAQREEASGSGPEAKSSRRPERPEAAERERLEEELERERERVKELARGAAAERERLEEERVAALARATRSAPPAVPEIARSAGTAPSAGHVWIVGLVERPGRYSTALVPTVLRAIEVTGLRPGADVTGLEVERAGGGSELVDLGAIRSGRADDVGLLPGDSVVVPGVGW